MSLPNTVRGSGCPLAIAIPSFLLCFGLSVWLGLSLRHVPAESTTDPTDLPLHTSKALQTPAAATSLATVANKGLPSNRRIAALLDPQTDLTADPANHPVLLGILRDPQDDDTIRNEIANAFGRNPTTTHIECLLDIVANQTEGPRFRHFAVQHAGMWWLGSQDDCPPEFLDLQRSVKEMLLNNLQHQEGPTRREALLALTRNKETAAKDRIEAILSENIDPDSVDLAIRLAGEWPLPALSDRITPHLQAKPVTEQAWQNCLAAIHALAKFGTADHLTRLDHLAEETTNPRLLAAIALVRPQQSGSVNAPSIASP